MKKLENQIRGILENASRTNTSALEPLLKMLMPFMPAKEKLIHLMRSNKDRAVFAIKEQGIAGDCFTYAESFDAKEVTGLMAENGVIVEYAPPGSEVYKKHGCYSMVVVANEQAIHDVDMDHVDHVENLEIAKTIVAGIRNDILVGLKTSGTRPEDIHSITKDVFKAVIEELNKEFGHEPTIVIDTFHITTGMGKVHGNELSFLSPAQREEFNEIGYTGKLGGVKTSRQEYLNNLNIGQFSIEQTRFDNGDFTEEFTITRATQNKGGQH